MTEQPQQIAKEAGLEQEIAPNITPIADGDGNGFQQAEKGDIAVNFAANDPNFEPPSTNKSNQKPQKSKGEKTFDFLTYTGLNYWVNLISSLAIADYLLNLSGRKHLDGAIEKATIGVSKILGASKKSVHGPMKVALETLSLMSGGWLLVVPMKFLEDNKRSIVHWLNEKLGVDQTAPDGHKETPEEIHIEKEQPKQSWGRAFMRRIYATVAVVGSGLALDKLYKDKNNILPDKSYVIGGEEIIYKGQALGGKDRLTGSIVDFLNKGFKHLPMGEKIINHAPTQRWMVLAALDVFFTVITAVVMKITNGAKPAKMPCEIDDSKDVPSHYKNPNEIVPDAKWNIDNTNENCSFVERVGKKEPAPITKREKPEAKSDESFLTMIQENKPALALSAGI